MHRWFIVLGLLVATALPAGAKTLVFCSEGSPESLNPQLVTTTTAMNAGRPMFNNLVEFAPGTTQLVPALAESWTVSPDATAYTFRLRAGVKFHANALFRPSRDFNADDVIFSLERQWRQDNPYHRVSNASFDYFMDMEMPTLLTSIEKLDDLTVRITLSHPEAPFLADLAMAFAVIHSAEYAQAMLRAGTPERLDQQPIGTGPFALVSYQPDVAIRFRGFPAYWGGANPIGTLVFAITPNPIVRLTKLKAGECQVMALPNPGDTAQIAANDQLRLLQQEGLNIGYLAMNTSRPPFDDVRVRRAVATAIDKATIVEAVYGGAGAPATNPIPPTLWSYNDAIKDEPYDPGEARRMLAEAGHPQGFETELWYMPVSRPYNPNAKRVAEMIQSDLARIGIHVRLVTDDWGSYRARLQAGEPPMAIYGWTGDNGDPDNFLHVLLGCASARIGGQNIAKWCDPVYDDLVTRAKATADQAERERLYAKAQEVFKQQAPWVPIAHSVVFTATRREVTGFRMDPLGRQMFQGVDIAEKATAQ